MRGGGNTHVTKITEFKLFKQLTKGTHKCTEILFLKNEGIKTILNFKTKTEKNNFFKNHEGQIRALQHMKSKIHIKYKIQTKIENTLK